MNCSEMSLHLEAYALGALEPFYRARVEKHLATCTACRTKLASLQQVVGELPHALGNTSPLRPPAALKNKIMQAAQADLQVRAIQETFAPRAAPPAPLARRGRWLVNPRVWMVSLSVAIFVIVVLVGVSYLSTQAMQQALAREQSVVAELNSVRQNAQVAEQVKASVLKQNIILAPNDPTSNATGKVELIPNQPTLLFTASNLPKLGLNERYFLWTINKGSIQLAAQFTASDNGYAQVVIFADRDDPVLKEIFLTRQPIDKILPSNDRILTWRANPNDTADEFNPNNILPYPTVISPNR